MAKTYEITDLDKNVKSTQNCDEHLMYRLFLLIETNYHDLITFGMSWLWELPVEHMVVH